MHCTRNRSVRRRAPRRAAVSATRSNPASFRRSRLPRRVRTARCSDNLWGAIAISSAGRSYAQDAFRPGRPLPCPLPGGERVRISGVLFILERIPHQHRVLALGAGREQRHRRPISSSMRRTYLIASGRQVGQERAPRGAPASLRSLVDRPDAACAVVPAGR